MDIDQAKKRIEWAQDVISKNIPTKYMQGARFLDVGCGSGNGVIAALTLGAVSAVGIDRDGEEFGDTHFAAMAEEFGVDVRATTLLATDVFNLSFFDPGFDVVMMYDAIEHVPNPSAFIKFCGNALRPGGICLIMTSPLYYGAVGHHLWDHFPEATMPWVHLYPDFEQRMVEAGVGDWGKQRYYELNKVTHGQLLQYIDDAGMQLVADNSIYHDRFPPMLEQFRHLIDMSLVPSEQDLLCDYTSLLFTRPHG